MGVKQACFRAFGNPRVWTLLFEAVTDLASFEHHSLRLHMRCESINQSINQLKPAVPKCES